MSLVIEFTEAEISIVRQALRAEHDRMVKQGYAGLAKLADEARTKLSNAILDNHAKIG